MRVSAGLYSPFTGMDKCLDCDAGKFSEAKQPGYSSSGYFFRA